jgi:hypothetical protein
MDLQVGNMPKLKNNLGGENLGALGNLKENFFTTKVFLRFV